jgi:hypothetical protein
MIDARIIKRGYFEEMGIVDRAKNQSYERALRFKDFEQLLTLPTNIDS